MKVATPRELTHDERRVALVPDTATKLIAARLDVAVEAGAGAGAFIPDDAFNAVGVKVITHAADLMKGADAVLKVQAPMRTEVELLREGAVLISFLQPST